MARVLSRSPVVVASSYEENKQSFSQCTLKLAQPGLVVVKSRMDSAEKSGFVGLTANANWTARSRQCYRLNCSGAFVRFLPVFQSIFLGGPSMATYENFDDNFAALLGETKAIPPGTRPELLPEHIKAAIDGLTPEHIEMLNKLAEQTKSHIFLHDHNNNVIAMGL
jgi:hypothetical protein